MENKENYKVYMHINKSNQKVYVGLTKQLISRRWNHGNAYKKCPLFWKAIQKYGWDGFDHIVVKEDLTKDEAAKLECNLIAKYDATNPQFGYNCDDGGFAGSPSEAVREKLRVINTGKRYSDETRLKHSISSKMRDVQFTDLARQRSVEARRKMVFQYDNDRKLIHKWDSISNAAKSLGANHQNIVRCCLGKSHTCGGYFWSYSDSEIIEPQKRFSILQIDPKTNLTVAQYESIQDASLATGIQKGNICSVCNGRRTKAGGYRWARKGVTL